MKNDTRLEGIASRAKAALAEATTHAGLAVEAWLKYGFELNEGREMFPEDDKGFGLWKQREIYSSNLEENPHPADEAAAVWAAANPDDFAAMREAHPKVRTVRGWHDKWRRAQKAEGPIQVEDGVVVLDESYGIPHMAVDLRESDPVIRERLSGKEYDEEVKDEIKWPSMSILPFTLTLSLNWEKDVHKGKTFGIALLDEVKEKVQFFKDYPEFNSKPTEENLEFILMMTDELFKVESDLKTQLEEMKK